MGFDGRDLWNQALFAIPSREIKDRTCEMGKWLKSPSWCYHVLNYLYLLII